MYFSELQNGTLSIIPDKALSSTKNVDSFLKTIILWSDECQQQVFMENKKNICLGPVVQSVVSLTSSLRVISLSVLAD